MRGEIVVIFAVCVVGFILLTPFIFGLTFSQRCAEAGYERKAHEQCVIRLKAGGNVYE